MLGTQQVERGVEAGVVQSGGETALLLLHSSIPLRRTLSWPHFTYEGLQLKGHSECVGQILKVSSALSLSGMQPLQCIISQRGRTFTQSMSKI